MVEPDQSQSHSPKGLYLYYALMDQVNEEYLGVPNNNRPVGMILVSAANRAAGE